MARERGLAPAPRRLRLALERDIARVDDEAGHGRVVEQVGDAALERPRRPVAVPELDLGVHGDARLRHDLAPTRGGRIVRVGSAEITESGALQLAGVVAEQPCGGRARVLDHPIAVDDCEVFRRVLHERPEPGFAPGEFGLHGAAFGDVAGNVEE